MEKQPVFIKTFFRSNILITTSILFLLFLVLTKFLPFILISKKIIYDKEGILMKAKELASILCWPISSLLPSDLVYSYFFLPVAFLYYFLLVILLSTLHSFLRSRKLYRWIFPAILFPIIIIRLYPNLFIYLDSTETSKSIGTPGNGKLDNGKRLVFEGNNFQYFNFLSYIKGFCFVHEKVKQTLLDAYKTCEKTCPGILFTTGEGSKKNGGPYVFNHRTHQNGTSIDLLLVFKKENKQYNPSNLFNAYGYGLDTDSEGKINHSRPVNFYPVETSVDFETNAKFLLALDDACKKNGIKIRIVILKVELKSFLFATPSGKKLLTRNIRFANALPDFINQAHDDHFHIDFQISH